MGPFLMVWASSQTHEGLPWLGSLDSGPQTRGEMPASALLAPAPPRQSAHGRLQSLIESLVFVQTVWFGRGRDHLSGFPDLSPMPSTVLGIY